MSNKPSPKAVMKWIFSEILEEFPEYRNINIFGFNVKNIDAIFRKKLDDMDEKRLSELLQKLYKGLETYYAR
jgi:hypothetical protein